MAPVTPVILTTSWCSHGGKVTTTPYNAKVMAIRFIVGAVFMTVAMWSMIYLLGMVFTWELIILLIVVIVLNNIVTWLVER